VFLVVLLFGRGKISELMGDVAKGINSFKKGLADGEETDKTPAIEDKREAPVADRSETKEKAEG